MATGGELAMIEKTIAWLTDPANWQGIEGIPNRLVQHIGYTVIAMLIALVIAIPLGLWIGHTGKGGFLVAGMANALRAIPTFGLVVLGVLLLTPVFPGESNLGYEIPAIAVLVILAVPPILAGTYAGVQAVDPAARDAAYGMGMTGRQVLLGIEVPCALPLLMSGVRSAMLQVISTATVAAYVSLGGLGRFVFDGKSVGQFEEMLGGSLLVAALAIVAELILVGVQRTIVSPGLTGRSSK